MRILIPCILTSIILMSWCSSDHREVFISPRVFEIVWTDWWVEKIRGMWVMIDDRTVLTSAHVVDNDAFKYILLENGREIRLSHIDRDLTRDIALMWIGETKSEIRLTDRIFRRLSLAKNEPITTYLIRSGSIIPTKWTIRDPDAHILGYTPAWQTRILSGVVLTDLDLSPWDSGAPVYDSRGELIDVVHVMNE